MYKFKSFLAESHAANEEKLTHLEHAEDHVINAGHEGFSHAYNNLMDVHNKLLGKKNKTKVTVKYDGSPSVIFGRNPDNGKFFVASKSAFNAAPKINYTPEDIERNHGHAPGLVSKLKAALKHLPKVAPEKGVFQGDIMHTPEDIKKEKGKISFKPNTITYSAPENSEAGQKAKRAKIGIAVHTAYEGDSLAGMKAKYAPDLKFNEHPDVHTITTEHEIKPQNYTPKEQEKFKKHIDAASSVFANTPEKAHAAIEPHQMAVKTYINDTVKNDEKPTVEGLKKFMTSRRDKAVSALKSVAGRGRALAQHNANIQHVEDNKENFKRVFDMHHHLQQAKDVLTNSLSKNPEFEHTINNKPTKPEGFVVVRNNRPTKFVDRAEFSKANFAARPR